MRVLYRELAKEAGKAKTKYVFPGDRSKGGSLSPEDRIKMLADREDQKQRKRLDEPVRFFAPHAGIEKDSAKDGRKDGKGITLMELSDRYGRRELTAGPDGGKTSFTATVSAPGEEGGLREDMRRFDRDRAKKQIRTARADVFLAGGRRDDAAAVELEQSGGWNEERLRLLRGGGRSSVLEAACPYADDTRERQRLAIVKEQLEQAKRQAAEIQRDGPGAGERLREMKEQENELAEKAEALAQMIAKKDYLRRVMLQRLRYATAPACEAGFLSGRRGGRFYRVQREHDGEVGPDADGQQPDALEDVLEE